MVGLRKIVAGSVAAALMISSASPAMAGWGGGGYGSGYGGYDGYGGRHRHRGHDDAGAIIGAIAVVGIIAAIASASSKSKQQRGYPSNSNSNNQRGSINSENAAVDACANATEQRGGQMASVRDIQNVRANSDGWDVEGTVEQRSDWRDRTPERHRFTCSVRYGEVDSVYIDGDAVALR